VALADAITKASAARRFDVVAQLARELEARRLARAKVVQLDGARKEAMSVLPRAARLFFFFFFFNKTKSSSSSLWSGASKRAALARGAVEKPALTLAPITTIRPTPNLLRRSTGFSKAWGQPGGGPERTLVITSEARRGDGRQGRPKAVPAPAAPAAVHRPAAIGAASQ